MNIPYVSVSYIAAQARRECDKYVVENHENIKKVRYIHPFQVVKNDGTEIFFMSEITFKTWCKGRMYKIFGNEQLCHSGHTIQNIEDGSELECAKKQSKAWRSFDYFLEFPKEGGT